MLRAHFGTKKLPPEKIIEFLPIIYGLGYPAWNTNARRKGGKKVLRNEPQQRNPALCINIYGREVSGETLSDLSTFTRWHHVQ